MSAKFSVVIPVYNEQESIKDCYDRLSAVMRECGDYELIFVNDGSADASGIILSRLARDDAAVKVIKLSRNFGQQAAITAGTDKASGDAVIVIDCDLQDPPEVIPLMIEKWRLGYMVVYAKRVKRRGESLLKRVTAKLHYKFLSSISKINIDEDVGDFRLMDRRVCDILKDEMREKGRYLRGMTPWIGFSQICVEYERNARDKGVTKYSPSKMLNLSLDGIISFGAPFKLAIWLGLTVTLCGAGGIFFNFNLIFTISLLIDGIMLTMLGIMGEYVTHIIEEVKNRPIYIIEDTANFNI